MAGRPKEPVAVLVAKGKWHMTEAEIAEREASEVHPANVTIVVPDYLDETEAAKFRTFAQMMINLGTWDAIDGEELARYIKAEKVYEEMQAKLERAIKRGSNDEAEKIHRMQDRAYKQATTSARALGMGASARCKLVIPGQTDGEGKVGPPRV